MFESLALPALKTLGLTGGAGGAAGPATSGQGFGNITPAFDSSGWTVATSGSKATGAGSPIPYTMLILGALAALVLWKKL